MDRRDLAVIGVTEYTPAVHRDDRGSFAEVFRQGHFPGGVAQVNLSTSRRGTLRGLHWTDVPPGQAKYVMCVTGSIIDFVVDLRVDSPTFRRTDAVALDPQSRRAVSIPVGVGHAFLAMADDTTVVYLCSSFYDPANDRTLDALDPDFGLRIPSEVELIRSQKDAQAPTLREAVAADALPSWAACVATEGGPP